MPLPLDGIENKYSVRKCLPLGEGVFVCWMLSYLVRLSAMGCCFCSELYKAKFAMPYREGGCVSALSIEQDGGRCEGGILFKAIRAKG